MSEMLKAYETYLELIGTRLLKKYFEQQKDYLHCKEGCSYCCETGEYPFSELEFQYLLSGYNKLPQEEKDIIKSKVKKIKEEKAKSSDEVFLYECPFLINKRCCLYDYRGLICRTHGIPFFVVDDEGNSSNKMPYCVNLGLNYSNVYDKERNTLSSELWKKSGIEAEPLAYNLSLKALMKNGVARELGIDFGELRALIDWFE